MTNYDVDVIIVKYDHGQWRLVGLSSGRAGARIIIWFIRRHKRVSFSSATEPLMFSVYSRVNIVFITI
jgi:hypothetical protein